MLNKEIENNSENQSGEKGVVKKVVNERAKNLTYKNAGIFVAIVAVVILIIALSANQKKAINAQEYLKYTIAGANGYAKITTSFDSYSMCDDINDEINDYMKTASISDALKDTSIEVSKSDKLCNGDTINITLTYNKEALAKLGYKLKNTTFSVNALGLVEPIVLDPFADLSVEFVGISPKVQVELTNNSTDSNINSYVTYTIEGEENYKINYHKNSDSIKVTAKLKTSSSNTGKMYILTESEKEFVVSVDSKYIDSIDDLSSENIEYLKSKSNDRLESALSSSSNNYNYYYTAGLTDIWGVMTNKYRSLTNMELYDAFLLFAKDSTYGDLTNKVYLIYKCDLQYTYDGTEAATLYVAVDCNDVIKATDSSINYNEKNSSGTMQDSKDFDALYNKIISANVDDYTATKIIVK